MQKEAFNRMVRDPERRGRIVFLFRILQILVLFWILLGVALFLFFYTRGSFT